MAKRNSTSEQPRSNAERWSESLGWLDAWFQPEKAEEHDFDSGERELFDALAPAWLKAEPGEGKIAALESAAERFGRARVLALIERICADEARAQWTRLVREGGGTLDDLLRMLWEPLPQYGFEFSSERLENGIQFRCTHCPHYELARDMGATEWLTAFICSSDPHIADVFGPPPIRFRRTKTLMQGDDCCDQAYFVD